MIPIPRGPVRRMLTALAITKYGAPPHARSHSLVVFRSLISVTRARVAGEGITLVPPSTANSAAVAAAAGPTLLQPRVLIYDGVCHLCHRGVKWVIEVDKEKKIKFCCLQSKAAEPYLRYCGRDREDVLHRVLFVDEPGSFYEGSAAVLKVASHLPFPYRTLSAFLLVPAPLRDVAYDYVAKRRYGWFGKEDECIVKNEKELLDRFIDRDEMLGGDRFS